MKKKNFKKGDKVLCINNDGVANLLQKGRLYTVHSFYTNERKESFIRLVDFPIDSGFFPNRFIKTTPASRILYETKIL